MFSGTEFRSENTKKAKQSCPSAVAHGAKVDRPDQNLNLYTKWWFFVVLCIQLSQDTFGSLRVMNLKHTLLRLAVCLSGIAYIVIAVGCSSRGTKVKFVLPREYQGFFKVYEDREDGEAPEFTDGVYIYRINETKILQTKDISPLRTWHQKSASYLDGSKLKVYPSPDFPNGEMPKDEIALFTLETYSTGETYYFVGTKSQYDAVRYNRNERGGLE
ncbi:MAG: hypothetical protein ACSHX8_12665 [Opitutaceae bacterium]